MDIKPGEITDILKREIKEYGREIDIAETGTVLSYGDGIARVDGLKGAMAGEMLEFETESGEAVIGMVLNLEENEVGAVLMGETSLVKEGDTVSSGGQALLLLNRRGFDRELRRVAKEVVYVLPPVWDIAAALNIWEHRWLFLTLRKEHRTLPRCMPLPFARKLQARIGQRVAA